MPDTLTIISSMATRRILAEHAGSAAQDAGLQTKLHAMGGVDALARLRRGEAADVVVLADSAMAALEQEGVVAAGTRTPFARSEAAAAVPAGRPHPAIGDENALRQAVTDARAIGYSTGASGQQLVSLWRAWGILEAIRDRLVQAPPGVPVGQLLATGAVDLGFQQTSELMDIPGVEIVGMLPSSLGLATVFEAGISTRSRREREASAYVSSLRAPAAHDIIRRGGMEPA